MKLTHLPAHEYRKVPWKNGAGHTQEMVIWPPDASMTNFHWRISMATVAQAGGFSWFPNIDRHLTVLHGVLRLEVEGQWHRLNAGQGLQFRGDVPVFGAPVRGDVTDLNVMTRRGLFQADVRTINSGTPFEIGAGEAFVFAFASVHFRGHDLDRHDLLRFESQAPTLCAPLLADVLLINFRPARA